MQPQQAQPNQPPIEAKESPLKLLPNVEDVIKSIHSTAKFSRILGILIIIIVPLAGYGLYDPKTSQGVSLRATFITSVVLGLIQGGILFILGSKLKKISAQDLDQGSKVLNHLILYLCISSILGLLFGSGGIGILNFILIYDANKSRGDIKKILLQQQPQQQQPQQPQPPLS